MSDGDILIKARTRYSQEVGGNFNLEHCWQVVKDSPQWTTVPTMSSDAQNTPTSRASKRNKTSESSDAHDEQETRGEIQEPRRPIGRNKAKNASTSNTTGSNPNDKFNCLLSEIKGFKDQYHVVDEYRMKKLENDIQKEERKDFEFSFRRMITLPETLWRVQKKGMRK